MCWLFAVRFKPPNIKCTLYPPGQWGNSQGILPGCMLR